MQVLANDGARIDASVSGLRQGDAVVFIHGFPFARAIWDAQADALATTHFVVRADLRGAGASEIPQGPYLMETHAGDVAALLDALGIERATLVGHSMGGYVALAFARMFTERLERLALISSRLAGDTPEQAAARRALADRIDREGSIEPVIEAYLPRLLAPQTRTGRRGVVERAYEIARQNDARGAAGTLRGMALRAAADDIAEELEVPVLVVAGACDELLSLGDARATAERFPSGALAVCGESGHLPMMEEPALVTAALREWL